MNKVEELQKRVEHLETEVELLKELVKLQNKCSERLIPTYPSAPLQPHYTKEPHLNHHTSLLAEVNNETTN